MNPGVMAPVPGERRECVHPRARHQHGTRLAYIADNCHCEACTAANLAATRQRVRAKTIGTWQPFAPADPIRQHLEALRSAGIGIDQIARLTTVPGSTIRMIIYGKRGQPPRRVRAETADHILAITPNEGGRARRSTVDATITRTQIHELLAAGWRYPDLAAELGRRTANLRRTAKRSTVTVQTATDIARLHQRLLRGRRQLRVTPRPTPNTRHGQDLDDRHPQPFSA